MSDKSKANKHAMPETSDKVTEVVIENENVTNSTMEANTTEANTPTETEALVEVNGDQIDLLRSELDEQKEKYLRLVAEFDNFRKRSRKEHYELEQTAGKDVIVSLLVVLDDMDRAAKQMETSEDLPLIKEGISLVFNKLRSTVQKRGVNMMEMTDLNFNPDIHEAITEIPVTDPSMEGKVIDVIEPGYYLNDKLIRCAKVVIGKVSE